MAKIPFHIISGFLGSGKTTLLKRIVDKYSDKTKIGIIQNEFAPANIDGKVLRGTGKDFSLLEIKNGSVFCSCMSVNFARSLEKFISSCQPDVVIIESSGFSDTTSVAEIVSFGNLADKIYLASNWCIVDAVNYAKNGLQKERVTHQLRMADIIVINKTDLLENGTGDLKKEIKNTNPFAEIKEAAYCNIGFEIGAPAVDKFYPSEVKALGRPEIYSMVIRSRKRTNKESLLRFLHEWSPKAFRIKGLVNLDNGKTVAVQCTSGSVEIEEIKNISQDSELIALTNEFTLRKWNMAFKELGTKNICG